MDIFEGRGYGEFGKGNFSIGNMDLMANGMGNIGNIDIMANGMGNIGNLEVESLSKSNCSSGSIFASTHFREAAEKLRDQVRKLFFTQLENNRCHICIHIYVDCDILKGERWLIQI